MGRLNASAAAHYLNALYACGVQQGLGSRLLQSLRRVSSNALLWIGLLLYAGWSDPILPGGDPVHYYEEVTRAMGGRDATESFARMFMMPGVGHCSGGPGPDTIDPVTALERWVEKGLALDTERFLESVFALARAGKANGHGVPRNPLQLAVLLDAFRDEFRPAGPPAWVLRATCAVGAAAGRRLGYRV